MAFLEQKTLSVTCVDATFLSDADFRECMFRRANFEGASFQGGSIFWRAHFLAAADYPKVHFSGVALFQDAGFEDVMIFLSAIFENRADFSCTKEMQFKNAFSRIASIGTILRFTIVCFGLWPTSQELPYTDFRNTSFLDTQSLYAAREYRALKLALEEHRARDEEGRFYALEQQSLRNDPNTPRSTKLVSLFYETMADNGRSFLRPLFWLNMVIGIFFLVYLWIGWIWGVDLHNTRIEILVFTIEQILRPFHVWTEVGS